MLAAELVAQPDTAHQADLVWQGSLWAVSASFVLANRQNFSRPTNRSREDHAPWLCFWGRLRLNALKPTSRPPEAI